MQKIFEGTWPIHCCRRALFHKTKQRSNFSQFLCGPEHKILSTLYLRNPNCTICALGLTEKPEFAPLLCCTQTAFFLKVGLPVKLHCPDHPVLLGRYPDEEEPVLCRVRPVVDHLTPRETGVSVKDLDGRGVALHAPVVHRGFCHPGGRKVRDG